MPILDLTRDEILHEIDVLARARRGLSAHQLLFAYREGRLEEPGEVADLLALADLLDENDPVFAA